ncbi:hypothetical protein [Nesterenkonia sp. CF4.4]|uniref:hypothetical protein n=1 Tax=Nesterenkonia sp. CF4.4 TaxID=3373079 RepID=UPI003EE44302
MPAVHPERIVFLTERGEAAAGLLELSHEQLLSIEHEGWASLCRGEGGTFTENS